MTIQMVVTYVVVDMFCIIIACTMGANLNSDFGSEFEVKTFRRALVAYCGFQIFGLIWVLAQHGYLPYNTLVVWIANELSLIMMNLTPYYWFLFAMSKLSRESAFHRKSKWYFTTIPIALIIIACLSTPWTGLVFTITPAREYVRGPLFIPVFLLSYIYDLAVCIYALIAGIHEKQKERRKLCWVIGLFIVFPMVAGVIQLMIAGTPIMAPSIITAFFLVFSTMQGAQIYNDALTGMNNRKRAFQFLERLSEAHLTDFHIVIYMIDVDHFKSINDQWGHIEGDRALKLFAEVLMNVAADHMLFAGRYGGDEFILVDSGHRENVPDQIVQCVEEQLRSEMESRKLPYELTVSIGYAVIQDRKMDWDSMIRMADEKLYEVKKKKMRMRRS